MGNLKKLTVKEIQQVTGGASPGWYNPIWYNSNIECKNDHAYGPNNLKNGTCKVNWNGVANNVINGAINSGLHGFVGH
ncbi:hypothetical protein FQS96_14345 [Enterococcus faecalis]|uniref:hypothetical protein n=1 Tax=Enterococcus TaxID=1350 RepID=UPI001A957323|nr:hypothetical protein [Enterococcus faecalis]MBO1126618.1 hypothetical protein [Enterococcus faecalis]